MVEFMQLTDKLELAEKNMFKRLFILALILLVCGLVALPFMITSNAPEVTSSVQFDAVKIDQAKAFLQRNDPRQLEAGEFVTMWVDESDISLAGNYLINQITTGALAVQLNQGTAYAAVSLTLPENPIGQYLNALIVLSQTGSTLSVESLRLGSLTIPRSFAEPIRAFGHERLMSLPEYRNVINSLNGMQILDSRMLVQYQWNPDVVDSLKARGKELLVDEAMRERLLAYSRQIRQVVASDSGSQQASLADVLSPTLQLANLRGGDPAAENAAAILALSFYFSGVDIARMFGVDLPREQKVNKKLTLSDRYDFTQHFLTSAALTIGSRNSGIADTIGIFKELDDAKGGSGFSFTDVGADRAGVRFAELATKNAASAKFVQQFFIAKPPESEFMPNFLDLPELMPNDEFKRRFGDTADPRYLAITADIETRLDNTPIYQRAPSG